MRLLFFVTVAALAGCAAPLERVPPDWQNPDHRLVGQQLSPLLRAAGRNAETCEVFFLEAETLNAAQLGHCTFGFTTILAQTATDIFNQNRESML